MEAQLNFREHLADAVQNKPGTTINFYFLINESNSMTLVQRCMLSPVTESAVLEETNVVRQ